jgi:phosphonate transport system substrate-binding protein
MIRKIITLLLASLILAGASHSLRANHKPSKNPIRFGLTAVVVRENLRFLDRWAQYLSTKMERPVEFVRRRSYREIMDMLELGKLDFAWICGFPFIQNRDPEFLDIMTVPIYAGAPLYHSYIIVHADSPFEIVADLKGKVFAFSDPESNSGFLYPQHVLAEAGHSTEHFFRQTFFTYSHAETVEAVAEHVADGGAVDSYIWEYLQDHNSEFAAKTRIIQKSPPFGFPPLVSRRGVDAEVVDHLTKVLLEMSDDPDGRVFLDGLKLDGFGEHPADLFDDIRQMANDTRKSLLWIRSAETKPSTEP